MHLSSLLSLTRRLVGLGVAAIVLVAATQLLLLGFESDPLLSRARIDDLADWVQGRPSQGALILGGGALALLSLALLVGSIVGVGRPVLTTRRRRGWTKIDRRALAASIERRLDGLDRRADVNAKVTRRGRVDVRLVTPDVSSTGSVQEVRDAIETICTDRSLPCRLGRIVALRPRRMTKRRRVR